MKHKMHMWIEDGSNKETCEALAAELHSQTQLCPHRVLVTIEDAPESAGSSALVLAKRFHDLYERLAPYYGYETRKETRVFNPNSKNGRLMIAVCATIQNAPEALFEPPPAPVPMTPEYAASQRGPMTKEYALAQCGRLFMCEGSECEVVSVGQEVVFDEDGDRFSFDFMAAYCTWTDGAPCAMPQRKDGEG